MQSNNKTIGNLLNCYMLHDLPISARVTADDFIPVCESGSVRHEILHDKRGDYGGEDAEEEEEEPFHTPQFASAHDLGRDLSRLIGLTHCGVFGRVTVNSQPHLMQEHCQVRFFPADGKE